MKLVNGWKGEERRPDMNRRSFFGGLVGLVCLPFGLLGGKGKSKLWRYKGWLYGVVQRK